MMVMPMGPDFAGALGIEMSKLGLIGGAYTAAATVGGILGSLWLDRFERRAALVACVAGLGLATAAGAAATGLWTLLTARAAAGSFGGLAATLCFSIASDLSDDAHRGRAMAIVASGFSIASIFGVPAGLELAHRGGWRAPFLVVGGIALLLAAAARLILPRLSAHMDSREVAAPLPYDARVWLTFAAFGFAILGNFLLVPNIPAYIQFNLGFPREKMGLLYLLGGLASLGTMRVAGAWTDRSGAFPPVLTGTAIVTVCLVLGLVPVPPIIPPLLFFAAFMGANAARWVSINALTSRVPHPSARARFLSAQNAFSHAACAAAAMGSTLFLTSDASGRLGGMPKLAVATATMGLFVPLVIWRLEKLVPPARKRAPEPLAPTAEI